MPSLRISSIVIFCLLLNNIANETVNPAGFNENIKIIEKSLSFKDNTLLMSFRIVNHKKLILNPNTVEIEKKTFIIVDGKKMPPSIVHVIKNYELTNYSLELILGFPGEKILNEIIDDDFFTINLDGVSGVKEAKLKIKNILK